jgi:hypothetical protein
MLFEKPFTSGDVISLKLISGEEVVGRLEEETATGFKITKPMVISMTPKGPGLMPFLFTVNPDSAVVINHSAVAVAATPDKGFADQYIQSTTGIHLT